MKRQIRARALPFLIGLVAPVCIALVFRTTFQRVVVPESLMLGVIVTLSLTKGLPTGMVAAASSVVSLWAIDLSPQFSFRAAKWEDVVAVIASGGVACGLAVLLGALRERDQAALRRSIELQAALDAQRLTIVTMQHALLPETVPATPDLTVGWHYRTGGWPETPIGGDWFAVVPISSTRVGLGIGDVSGHGLPAVKTMVAYCHALRILAVTGDRPARVLEGLDSLTKRYPQQRPATVLYGILDTENATWAFASAGHLDPVLVRGGVARSLEVQHAPLIGANIPHEGYPEVTVPLRPGDLVVLFTDGLVERRGESIDVGIDRLLAHVGPVTGADVSKECELIADDLAGDTPADDVAILIAQYNG